MLGTLGQVCDLPFSGTWNCDSVTPTRWLCILATFAAFWVEMFGAAKSGG